MARRPLLIFSRFLTVGLACALLHNAVVIGGYWLGLHYAVSSVMSFARYVLIASANLPLSLAGMFAFVDLGGLLVPIATPLVTVLLVVFNFPGGRWALKAAPLWRT